MGIAHGIAAALAIHHLQHHPATPVCARRVSCVVCAVCIPYGASEHQHLTRPLLLSHWTYKILVCGVPCGVVFRQSTAARPVVLYTQTLIRHEARRQETRTKKKKIFFGFVDAGNTRRSRKAKAKAESHHAESKRGGGGTRHHDRTHTSAPVPCVYISLFL